MVEKHDSRSASPTIEGIKQPNKNSSLGVGLRTETSGLEATLGNINSNMAKMSRLLEMMCSSRPQSTADFAKSPPAERKSINSLDELSHSDDDYSPPRKRFESYNSDDNVSLYADDDLDCNSSRYKSSPSEKIHRKRSLTAKASRPATLFKSFVDSFEEEDTMGDDIDPNVAELPKKRWGKKLNPEKIKEIVEKHKRPANCVQS